MTTLVTNIGGVVANPARRRFWLTMGSGGLIAAGLIARYGFGLIDLWSVLMVAAALLAGSDIALRAWRADTSANKLSESAEEIQNLLEIGRRYGIGGN